MSEIISKDAIRAKAREAFTAGRPRHSHGFNWHAPALSTWLEEYDRLTASQQYHTAPIADQRVAQAQGAN